MKSFIVIVLSLLTPILAHPTRSSSSKGLAPPFKIVISTPSLPMLVPIYLTSNGSASSQKSVGALCQIRASTELFCGNNTVPVGAPLGAPVSLLSAIRASEEAPYVGMGGGVLVTKGFSINNETLRIKWDNEAFETDVGFAYKMDESQSVWAVFAKGTMVDSVEAELVAVFN
ncbi:hypothetical protein EG329_011514 [Mollisiaceae sp. DMI_Dod_QoI]|nr:hypothetical protein EG329_011514 [Helotiales sp. DMI_Dod_QoI]